MLPPGFLHFQMFRPPSAFCASLPTSASDGSAQSSSRASSFTPSKVRLSMAAITSYSLRVLFSKSRRRPAAFMRAEVDSWPRM